MNEEDIKNLTKRVNEHNRERLQIMYDIYRNMENRTKQTLDTAVANHHYAKSQREAVEIMITGLVE